MAIRAAFLLVVASTLLPTLSLRAADMRLMTSRDGKIQISVPDGYAEKPPAKPTIKIEATSDSAGATVLVLSEGQRDFASLAAYAEMVRDKMMARLTDAQADAGEKIQAGDHPAIRYEITGISSNGQRMGFLLTVIQTETRFNQVVSSCSRARFAEEKREFIAIAQTLKELMVKTP